MSEPIYKPLDAADLPQYVRTESQAFVLEPTDVERWLGEGSIGHQRGVYHNGELVAQGMIFPFEVGIGPIAQPCGGLGGVATPPYARRRGYVGALLRGVVNELREQGTALCMLFPFKASFYHRYGWATCMERRVYHASPEQFAGFIAKRSGQFVPIDDSAIDELDAVYSGALRGRFGPLKRTEHWWKQEVLRAERKPYHGFLWRDDQGQARSYMLYKFEQRDGNNAMVCREIVALDPEARGQLFALLANHDSQVKQIIFRAPADAPINALLPDPLKSELEPYFMLRLIDVAAALSNYAYPRGVTGRFTLAINDDWLPHNQGVFELVVAEGKGQCRQIASDAPADLRCDVQLLTQLYTRFVRPRTAAAFGALEAANRQALALADKCFAGLAPFSSDFF